ncbi:MAG: hypothetical protein ACUVWR_02095 [Anaerolineae bacterium]
MTGCGEEHQRLERLAGKELVREAAEGRVRFVDDYVLSRITAYVAQAGFDHTSFELVDKQLVGREWQGRSIRKGDRLPSLERHYLKHVVALEEWPEGTTLEEYVDTARRVVASNSSGIMVSRLHQRWHISFLLKDPEQRPHRASDWIVVEYDVAAGHWWSVYRPWRGPGEVTEDRRREEVRWLRHPP